MITFSIPCWLLWFMSGNLTMLIALLAAALILGARRKKADSEETEPTEQD